MSFDFPPPGDVNVYPLDDLQEHNIDGANGVYCECAPDVEVIGSNLLIIHHSFDHREILEDAIDIMNGEYGEME